MLTAQQVQVADLTEKNKKLKRLSLISMEALVHTLKT
jgi:hypothetical protein